MRKLLLSSSLSLSMLALPAFGLPAIRLPDVDWNAVIRNPTGAWRSLLIRPWKVGAYTRPAWMIG
jgi:hypothetical protein